MIGPPGLIPNATTTPAHAGEVLTGYGTGWGATTPAAVVGSLAAGAATLLGDYSLTIGGVKAEVSYAGLAPNFAGLYQINFTVPAGLSPGNQPIVLTVNGVSTPVGAYLAVK
jgi:adhesin/invasin